MAARSSARRPASPRKPAAERRDEVVGAAIAAFAAGGYEGTSTEAIASAVGLSQPYLFRLFGTKRELFLACHEAVHERIAATFRAAAGDASDGCALQRMGRAYVELLADRELLLFQMQSYAACSDAAIQARVRARYGDLVEEVAALSGRPPEDLWRFFSTGMLLNVVASLDLDAVTGERPWAATWSHPVEAPVAEAGP